MNDEKQNDLGELLENTMSAGKEEIEENEYISLDDQEEFRRLDLYAEEGALDDIYAALTSFLNDMVDTPEGFNRDQVTRWLMMEIKKHFTGA
jgi:hypothetical protein